MTLLFKDPCEGVMSRGGPPTTSGYMPPGPVKGYVLNYSGHDTIYWSELEPTQGTLDGTVMASILTGLDDADTDGYTNGLKLRILYGTQAPAWAKTAFGTAIVETGSGTEDTCVLWWLPDTLAAFDDLTRRLAGELDGHPALRDVAITWGGIQYGEPFIRKINQTQTSTGDPTRTNLWDAFVAHANDTGLVDTQGRRYYTTGGTSDPYHGSQLNRAYRTTWFRPDRHYGFVFCDRAALRYAVRSHNRWWLKTRSSLAVNPYQQIVYDNANDIVYGAVETLEVDTARPHRSWTLGCMQEFRHLMTQRLVLGNNSLRYSDIVSAATQSDTFERADNSFGDGWGTADTGGIYTGSSASRRINSGRGEIRQDAVAERRVRHTNSRTGSSRLETLVSWTADAAGAQHWFGVEMNVQDISGTADGFYQLQMIQQAYDGHVEIRFRKQDSTVGSTTAICDAVTVFDPGVAGTDVWIVMEVDPTGDDTVGLRAKVWADGTAEPGWHVEMEDVTPDLANWDGHIGWRTNASAGYTANAVWQIAEWSLIPIGTPPPGGHVGGPAASKRYDALYQAQAELGGPLYYQTATITRLPSANWEDVMEWCATPRDDTTGNDQHGQGASYVELPSGYTAWSL